MSPKTAYLKQTSEQRCREAFTVWFGTDPAKPYTVPNPEQVNLMQAYRSTAYFGWQACWKYLEERLLKEIQS